MKFINKLTTDISELNLYWGCDLKLIEFVLCFGSFEKGKQTAVNMFQKILGCYYDYQWFYKSYRGQGLIHVLGENWANTLANACHVFGFGDLTKIVKPE